MLVRGIPDFIMPPPVGGGLLGPLKGSGMKLRAVLVDGVFASQVSGGAVLACTLNESEPKS